MLRLFMVYGEIFYLSKNAPSLTLTLVFVPFGSGVQGELAVF